MHTLHQVLERINMFLKMCDIDEIKISDQHCVENIDVADAVKTLCNDLTEISQSQSKGSKQETDSIVSQITASNTELKERIMAFMKYSQNKIDEQNVKEFCSNTQPCQDWGCARTDSIYKRRSCEATHMQVTKVVNSDGPQLKFTNSGNWMRPAERIPPPKTKESKVSHPVDERLHNIESHLNINTEQASDVYRRIKNLEDRLLAMEGSSPEYQLRRTIPSMSFVSKEVDPEDYSLQDVDDRVRQLKQSLLAKKRRMDESASQHSQVT